MSDVNMIEVEATVEDIQDIEAQIDETEPLNLDGYYRNNEPIVSVDDIPPNAIMPLSLVYGSDRTNKNVQFSDLESAFRTKIQYSTVSTTLAEPEVMAQTLTGFVSGLTLYGCSRLSNNLWSLNPSYEGAGTLVNKEKIYLDAGTYTISFKSNIENSNVTFTFYEADGTTSVGSVQISRPINKATVTLSNDAKKVLVSNGASSRVYDIQIESGSEATDYEAYGIISCSGDVSTRNLNGSIVTSAHTDFPMIGIGDSNLLSNNYLVINPKFGGGFYKNVDLRNLSELTWTKSGDLLKCSTIKYIVSRPSANDNVVRALCDSLKVDSYSNVSAKVNDRSIAVDTNGDIYVYFDEYKNDINGFKTEMARTSTKFIYQMNDYEFTRPSNDEIREFMRLRLFAKTYFSSPNGCCDFEYVSNQVIMDARAYTAYVDYYNGQAIDSVNERVDDVEEEISNINATKTTTTSPITDSTDGNINGIKLYGHSYKEGNTIIQPSGDVVSHNADNTKSSTVHTSRPLLSIGNIKNELIINADGSGKFVERVRSVDVSTLTWATTVNGYYSQSLRNSAKPSGKVILTGSYEYDATTWTSGKFGLTFNKDIWVGDTNYNTQGTLIYELATPTTTDLSVSEVAEMLALKTYSGTTYIDTDGAEFEVSYFVDSNIAKAISDNKGYITEVAESVDDVNETLNTLLPTRYISSGLTYTNCSYVNGGYCKIGKLVVANIRVTSSGTSFTIDGFPAYSNVVFASMVTLNVYDANSKTNVSGFVYVNGKFTVYSATSGHIYFISAIYLCN